jgi:hypothetical protein
MDSREVVQRHTASVSGDVGVPAAIERLAWRKHFAEPGLHDGTRVWSSFDWNVLARWTMRARQRALPSSKNDGRSPNAAWTVLFSAGSS